jgi:hypothetical protein
MEDDAMGSGPFWFGLVVGFITYRTLKHRSRSGISDIAAVIGALGGGATTRLFPNGSVSFENYCAGLAVGFFGYLAISLVLAALLTKQTGTPTKGAKAATEFLGSDDSQ